MEIICHEIGDTCYYVTGAQNRVLDKFEGEKKDKFIKKTSFARGKLGEPIKSISGAMAIVYPEGKGPDKLIDPNAPPAEVEEPTNPEPPPLGEPLDPSQAPAENPDGDPTAEPSEAEISGIHL